jgi:hypothetical protein
MPLRAIVINLYTGEEKEFITSLLSSERWSDLKNAIKNKKVEVLVASTNKKGIIKRSKLGLQYVAHKKGEAPINWKPESDQHLYLKHLVAQACQRAGWTPKVEVAGPGYISDVLASKNDRKIAFEIQWSKQSLERTIERQKIYQEDNLNTIWLFKNLPFGYRNDGCLDYDNLCIPMFEIRNEGSNYQVSFDKESHNLSNLIYGILIGEWSVVKGDSLLVHVQMGLKYSTSRCHVCKSYQDVPYPVVKEFKYESFEIPIINDAHVISKLDLEEFAQSPEFAKLIQPFRWSIDSQIMNWPTYNNKYWACSSCGTKIVCDELNGEEIDFDFSIKTNIKISETHWQKSNE